MGLVLRQFGYSLYSGTGLLNPNFPIKFRVPEGSTQISFRVRVWDSGIGFFASPICIPLGTSFELLPVFFLHSMVQVQILHITSLGDLALVGLK
jgi:hypothetical protein